MPKYLVIMSAYENYETGIFEAKNEHEAKVKFVKHCLSFKDETIILCDNNIASNILYAFYFNSESKEYNNLDEYIDIYVSDCYVEAYEITKNEGIIKNNKMA